MIGEDYFPLEKMPRAWAEEEYVKPKPDYAFDNDAFEHDSLRRGTPRQKDTCGGRKCCVIIVVVVLVAILALGLGLGLGLRKTEPTPAPEACTVFDRSQFAQPLAPDTNGNVWLKTDCTLGDTPKCPSGFTKPPLLIISLDGFRADYMKRNITPVLEKIANCGVKTEYMRSSYPTKTFPNHYSIVTGLYPESHGIIGNTMVDLEMDQIFTLSGEEKNDPRWWHGEPIWVTARKAGKKSATMFWPGSETKINGYYPNRCYVYDKSVPFGMRIDRILSWLDEPESTRPDVTTLYFSQPDSAGHSQGPDGDWVNGNLTLMDGLIGNLMDGLIERQLHTCIDIMIVADHGMSPVSCSHLVDIRSPLEDITHFVVKDGPIARITSKFKVNSDRKIEKTPNGASADEIVDALECVNYTTHHDYYSKVYKKENLPVRVHFSNSPRIEDVIVTAADEWLIKGSSWVSCTGGAHGYDNLSPHMQALFMAYGSSFKQTEIEPFENIELYNLMTDLLNISSIPNNGTSGRLHQVLRHPPSPPSLPSAGSNYQPVTFPNDVTDRNKRRAASDCNCTSGITDVDIADLRLNLTEAETETSHKKHVGTNNTPTLEEKGITAWMHVQKDSVRAYSKQHLMSLWAAFTLNDQSGTQFTNVLANCTRVDVRLETADTTLCTSYKDAKAQISASFLVPPGIAKDIDSQADSTTSSNLVPMYDSFREGIWKAVLELIDDYKQKYKQVNVLLGPVFDDNHDGLYDPADAVKKVPGSDVPLPSHYFVMLRRCDDTSVEVMNCPDEKIETMAMLIPHLNNTGNCWEAGYLRTQDNLQTHVARPRDVELITGLQLLRGVSDIRHQLLLKTRLYVGFWHTTSWMDEEECPKLDPTTCPNGGVNAPVLLISLDGFRPDYMDRGAAPFLQKLSDCGVRASFLQSVYPSLTFPNHYSQVTGLYPESHGIVDNNMFDLDINSTFYLGSPNASDTRWWGGEPIWNTVRRNGKTSATYFWPGSDVEIGGGRPDRWQQYDGNAPYSKRVDTVVDWLSGKGGFKADLVVLYMEKVDKYGHEYGPNSPKLVEAISYVDGYLNRLMDGLKRNNIDKCVNIIITSDHGMADISCDRGVQVADYIPRSELNKMRTYNGAAGRIVTTYNKNYQAVEPEDRVPIDMIVYNTSCKSDKMHVYDLKSLPKRFHFTNNARIGEALFVMEEEWQFNLYSPWCKIKGQHGYDAMTYDTMKALFRSYGPGFKENFTSSSFENIQMYDLITTLLNIDGAPNNGTVGSLYHLMATEPVVPSPGGFDNYTVPEYPATDDDYTNRTTSPGCNCDVPPNKTVKEFDERLNLTETQRDELSKRHLPHGMPTVDGQVALQSLLQEDYVTAYSPELGLPLWVAYSTTKQTQKYNNTNCLRPDVRLEVSDQPSCSDFQSSDYINNLLFPPSLASSEDALYDAYLLTNTVPMLPNFASGIWRHLVSVVQNWTESAGALHVISGPAFDYDFNGIADDIDTVNGTLGRVPIPSHYFMVMLSCPADRNKCIDMTYDTQAFIIEHRPNVTNCMTPDMYLYDNRARLRDVELLTGLELLTANSTVAGVRARTALPRNYGFTTTSS